MEPRTPEPDEFRRLFYSAPIAYGVLDARGQVVLANQALDRLTGSRCDLWEFIDEISADNLRYLLEKAATSPLTQTQELKMSWVDGARWVLAEARGDPQASTNNPHFFVSFSDITERKAVTRHLKDALEAKELLMRELNHRVKNNLQMISSMMALEFSQSSGDRPQDILERIQDRVLNLSYLFDLLYSQGGAGKVDILEMFGELGKYLTESFLPGSHVPWQVTGDHLKMDTSKAIVLGQIVHELLTNILKHGRADPDHPVFTLSIRGLNHGWQLELVSGAPVSQSKRTAPPGIGLLLVKILANQLQTDLEEPNAGGTKWVLTSRS